MLEQEVDALQAAKISANEVVGAPWKKGLLLKDIQTEQSRILKMETEMKQRTNNFNSQLEKKTLEIERMREDLTLAVKRELDKDQCILELQKTIQSLKLMPANPETIIPEVELTDHHLERTQHGLMWDLQNKCEKLVELQMALDDCQSSADKKLREVHLDYSRKARLAERNLDLLSVMQKQVIHLGD